METSTSEMPNRRATIHISDVDDVLGQKTAEKTSRSSSTSSVTTCFPMRFQIVAMLFTAIMVSFLLRSSMSMNILAMVQPSRSNTNNSTTVVADYGPRYDWSPLQQSILLASGFAGSTVIILPLGILLDRFGHVRQVVLSTFVMSGVLQLLGPWAAEHSFEALVAIVLLTGIVQGGIVLAAHKFFTTWAPPAELGIFTSAIMGTNLGTIVSWSVSGALIETCGWPYSFYFNAVLSGLFVLAWAYVAYDSPAQHPRCPAAERAFIEASLVHSHHSNTWPPIGSIVTSVPAWCLLLLQFGNLWGLFFLLTAAPKFVNEILGFELGGTGVLASLPYLARWLSSIGWAVLGRRMHDSCGWRLVNLRKFFCVFSHLLPGLCFIAVPYVSQTPYVCIAIMALSQALNGAAPQSTFATFHDIAPNYAVTMVSIINTIGSASGLIAPLMVAYATAERNTIVEWQTVFLVGAIGYIGPAVLFCIAGSASVQRWDSETPEASIVKGVSVVSGKHVATAQCDQSGRSGPVQGVMYGPMYAM